MGNKLFSYHVCNAATIDVEVEIQEMILKKTTKKAVFSFSSAQVCPSEVTIDRNNKPNRISPLHYHVYEVDKSSTVKITFIKMPKPFQYKTYQCRKGKGIIITQNLEIIENCNKNKPWIAENKDYQQECKEWKSKDEKYKQEKTNIQNHHELKMAEIEYNYNSQKWQQGQDTQKKLRQLQKKYGKTDEDEIFILRIDDDDENIKRKKNKSKTGTSGKGVKNSGVQVRLEKF